jgi:hypothetical protein
MLFLKCGQVSTSNMEEGKHKVAIFKWWIILEGVLGAMKSGWYASHHNRKMMDSGRRGHASLKIELVFW